MKSTAIRVRGISPGLLTNNYTAMMVAKEPGGRSRQSIPTPEEEARLGEYRDPQGRLVMPSAAFRKCCLAGGKGRKIGRFGLTGILAGAVFPADLWTILVDPNTGQPVEGYEVSTMRAVVQGKSAVLRSRPLFVEWAAEVVLDFDPDDVDEGTVRWALSQGGTKVGIGNFRPEKGGIYGRFEVLD